VETAETPVTQSIPAFLASFFAVLAGAVAPPAANTPVLAAPAAPLHAPLNRHDAEFRDRLLDSRLPLEPIAALGTARVLLIGDLSHLPQGKAWMMQNAAAFRAAGVTHIGFESLKVDQQDVLDAYQGGRLSRADLLARLLGRNEGVHRRSRKVAIEETLSAVDAVTLAGLKVTALGLPKEEEDSAFRVLADRIVSVIGEEGRMAALVKPRRLSRLSTAGWLVESGLEVRTFGFFFPEAEDLNKQLVRIGAAVRAPRVWAYVPLDPFESGMDGLALAPAAIPQPSFR